MKRLTTLMGLVLAAVLVAGAGYLGFRSTGGIGELNPGAGLNRALSAVGLRSERVQASAELQAPPTAPVSRGDVQSSSMYPPLDVRRRSRA